MIGKFEYLIDRFLTVTDIFGAQIQFRVSGQKKASNILGRTCTFLLLIPCLILVISELAEATAQQKPSVYVVEQENWNPKKFYLDKSNFTFAVLLTDLEFPNASKKRNLYSLILQQCDRTRNKKDDLSVDIQTKQNKQNKQNQHKIYSCSMIPLEPCNLEKHFQNPQQYQFFKNYNLESMSCINSDWHNIKQPYMQGSEASDFFSFLVLTALPCVNTTFFQGCAPQEQIDQQLQDGNLIQYFSTNVIDESKPDNPYVQSITPQITSFNKNKRKGFVNLIDQDTTISDIGILRKQLDTQEALIFKEAKQLYFEDQNSLSQPFFLMAGFQLNFSQKTRYRNYPKIYDILGKIGGLLSFLSVFIKIFVQPLINQMMETQTAIEISKTKIYSSNDIIQKISKQQDENQFSQRQFTEQSNLDDGFQWKNKINLSQLLKNSFKMIMGRQTFLKQEYQQIQNNLDIVTIIKKINELDNLKTLLLDTDQLLIFEILQIDRVQEKLENLNQCTSPEFEKNQVYNKNIKIYQCWKRLMNKQKRTEKDEKFLQIIEQDKQLKNQLMNQEEQAFEQIFKIDWEQDQLHQKQEIKIIDLNKSCKLMNLPQNSIQQVQNN